MDDKQKGVLIKYVQDMHSLENHGLTAISRQVDQLKDSGHTDAFAAVQGFQRTLESHIAALETRLTGLGASASHPVQDAASAVAGFAAGLYNAVRSEEASKSIRDDYTFFSHSAIAYLMMHTTAKAFGDSETAMLAERGYRDCARMVMEINSFIPELVIDEFRQDGLNPASVASDCHRLIAESWDSASQSKGFTRRVA